MQDFSATGNELFLPIATKRFEAVCSSTGIRIEWIVSTENTLDPVTLEKSYDGKYFFPFQATIHQHNNVFICTDKTPRREVQYYRLKQLQGGKAADYSPIVGALCKLEKPIITPNPTSGKFRIQSEEPIVSIIIKDITGKHLYEHSVTETNPVIDAVILVNGIYYLELHSAFTITEQCIIIKK